MKFIFEEYGIRLKEEIKKNYQSDSEFCRVLKIDTRSLTPYFKSEVKPTLTILQRWQDAGLDIFYIMSGQRLKKEDLEQEEETLLIPEFTSPVRGGTWNMVENDRYRLVSVPKMLVKGIKKPAKVDVIGMSMAPEIKYRDTVFFDMEGVPKNNDVVICTYNGDTMIKRYKSKKSGITLESNNPKFEPITVEEGKQFVIHGVVKRVIHNL